MLTIELKSDPKLGTHPRAMIDWFENHRFDVKFGQGGTLDLLENSLKINHPVIILTLTWAGHYLLVVNAQRSAWPEVKGMWTLADPAAHYERRGPFQVMCGERLEDEWRDISFNTVGWYAIPVPKEVTA